MRSKLPSLETFLDTEYPNSQYIQYKTIECYMRKGHRIIDNKVYNVLTIANIKNHHRAKNVIVQAQPTSTGLFGEFDRLVRQKAKQYGYDGVYVECVLNDFLPGVLERYGYKQVNIHGDEIFHDINYWYNVNE